MPLKNDGPMHFARNRITPPPPAPRPTMNACA